MSYLKVTKAVITAAGYGTRFLPATKTIPKELIPVINIPTIKYIVDNCVNAGIKDIIIVTRYGNHAIEDFFDSVPHLEKYLLDKGKVQEAESIKKIYSSANFIFVRQDQNLPYGSASPLYTVRNLLKDEAFVYCWGDDIVIGQDAGVVESVDLFLRSDVDATLFTTYVDDSLVTKLGMVLFEDNTDKVKKIIEKPSKDQIVSNYCSVSNIVFSPKILELLDPSEVKEGYEFMIQPFVDKLCAMGKVNAVKTKGNWFTTGDPLNYIKATIAMALSREDLRDDVISFIKSLNL